MIAIFRKEINAFFSSLIGYIAITIFLVANGLFNWVFTDTSILTSGYADLQPFFNFAPWIFLFLVPAITMRSFAEEKNTGTLEWLATRPVTDMQIIGGKFLASFTLVVFSVLPTIVYYIAIRELASPKGNVDTGGIFGAYIGLILLGGCFVAISLFASAISNNQIIAFITGLFLSFFCYYGFDALSFLPLAEGSADKVFNAISINQHYLNISKGYIDFRDVLYFASAITIFFLMTQTALASRKW